VIVLLMSARPLNLKETRAQAVLDIWYPGSAGGDAVADLLFGDATPGGKLPFTWIRGAAQAPNPYAHLISHDPANADKRYWNGTSAPTYPFGYGLSYTHFQYSNLHVARPAYAPGELDRRQFGRGPRRQFQYRRALGGSHRRWITGISGNWSGRDVSCWRGLAVMRAAIRRRRS
jgi:hypothetical protein